jgi:hypothetical protein
MPFAGCSRLSARRWREGEEALWLPLARSSCFEFTLDVVCHVISDFLDRRINWRQQQNLIRFQGVRQLAPSDFLKNGCNLQECHRGHFWRCCQFMHHGGKSRKQVSKNFGCDDLAEVDEMVHRIVVYAALMQQTTQSGVFTRITRIERCTIGYAGRPDACWKFPARLLGFWHQGAFRPKQRALCLAVPGRQPGRLATPRRQAFKGWEYSCSDGACDP